jgi:hypothetical protein
MAFVEDFSDFANVDDFAITVTFNGDDVDGIFDHAYVEVGGIESRRPVFQCATADVSAYPRDTPVVINGVNYKTVTQEPDGTGWSLVVLKDAT